MRRTGTWTVALALALAGAACKPKARELPICPEMVAGGKASESESRNLPIDVWFSVLVRGFDRPAMDAGEDPRECSGQPIAVKWPPELENDPRAQARKLPRSARTDADISFADTADGELLVWGRIDALENGDALGPVALVRWVERGLEIHGIGSVQAPGQRVRMRLEPLGDKQRVLVLESEFCPEKTPDKCAREAQLLPLFEQRFVSAPLIEDGQDTGPARFLLADAREETLKDGWVRRYELTRRLEFAEGRLVVHEGIRTRDCDPKAPAAPCEEHIAASEARNLEFRDGALYTTRGAWARVGKTAPTVPTE